MRKLLDVILGLFICFSQLSAQTNKSEKYLVVVDKDSTNGFTQHGFTNEKGVLKIPFNRYYHVFTDTIRTIGFVAKKQEGLIAIDHKGNELFRVLPFDNSPDELRDGLFRILDKNQQVGFANEKGKVIIKPQFDFASPFYKSLSTFCMGCPLRISFKSFEELEKRPPHNGKFGVINKKGKVVIPAIYDGITILENNQILATRNDKEYYFNEKGNIIKNN